MSQIICADHDYDEWTGDEFASFGGRRNAEIWHVPHEREPSKPLCGARWAGKLRRTKGSSNCSICRTRSTQHISQHHYPVLRALARGEPIPSYTKRYETPDDLYEHDLVFNEKGRMVLTNRGKLVAADIIEPVGWFDKRTGIYHARNPLQHDTLCNEICAGTWVSWDATFDVFRMLMAEGRKHRGREVTCVYCAAYAPLRHGFD